MRDLIYAIIYYCASSSVGYKNLKKENRSVWTSNDILHEFPAKI